MERVGESRIYSFASYLYSYIDALIQRVDEYAASFFHVVNTRMSDAPQLRDVEGGLFAEDKRKRDEEAWTS